MPKRAHTQLNCSRDGPWIILRAGEGRLTFSLRELVRDLMPAERSSNRRAIMAAWLKARDMEDRPELENEQKR